MVSQNKNQNKQTKRRSKFYAIKCNDRKTGVKRVQTESVLVQWGCSHPQAYGFHHPWITHGASPTIPMKKNFKTQFLPSLFYGVILVEINKQVSLLHIIHGLKFL